VGFGLVSSKARSGLIDVGTGPPKAIPYAFGKVANRLIIIRSFILRSSKARLGVCYKNVE
jgi:hypothetical protein